MRLCLYMSSNSHMKHFPHKEHQEKCFLLTFFLLRVTKNSSCSSIKRQGYVQVQLTFLKIRTKIFFFYRQRHRNYQTLNGRSTSHHPYKQSFYLHKFCHTIFGTLLEGVSISKFSRHGRMAAWPQFVLCQPTLVAAWPRGCNP